MSFDFSIIPNYESQIDRLAFSKTKHSHEEILTKAKRIFEGFIVKIEILPKEDIEFYASVIESLKEVAMLKPGRSLLKRLTKSLKEQTFKICDCIALNNSLPEFKPDEGAVYVSPLFQSYYISKQSLKDHPFLIQLIHESTHALHLYETPAAFWERYKNLSPFSSCSKMLLSPNLTNPEEQLTIMGVLDKNATVQLCENVFLRALGLPFRESHVDGIMLRSVNENIRLDHLIYANATKDIEQLLEAYPETVNQIFKIDWVPSFESNKPYANKNLLPLTFALKRLNNELIELLMAKPLQLDLEDDFGGPLLAFIDEHLFAIPKQLIEKGMQSSQKIPLEKIWDHLITGWQTGKLANTHNTEFKELLFYLNALLSDSNEPKAALFFPTLKGLLPFKVLQLVEWMIEDKIPLTGFDDQGNTLLMLILMKIREFKVGFMHMMPLTKKFLELITLPEMVPYHKNTEGDTVLTLTHKVGVQKLTESVEKALEQR